MRSVVYAAVLLAVLSGLVVFVYRAKVQSRPSDVSVRPKESAPEGTNLRAWTRKLPLPALIINLSCNCTTFDPANLRTWTAANRTWTLSRDGLLKRASDGAIVEAQILAKRLNPQFETQMFAIDGEGELCGVQEMELDSMAWSKLAASLHVKLR